MPGFLDPTVDEDAWAGQVEPNLAVGRSAVALSMLGGTVATISALDGSYHLVDLPGLDNGASFRFQDGVVALSPDGRRLAYTWNEASFVSHAEVYAPSGVRIVDLNTGSVSDHQVHKGFGVFSHGFAWSPDGRYVAYNTQIATKSQSGTRGSRNFFVERLDTATGERLRAVGVPMTSSPPAVTDAGTVLTGSGTTMWTWRADEGATRIDLQQSRQWRGSVVSVAALPGTETVFATAGLEYGRLFVGRPGDPASFRRVGGGGQRLEVEGFVDGGTVAALERIGPQTTLWTADRSGPRSGPQVVLEGAGETQYSFATTLLRRPTRDSPAPDWPLSMEQKVCRGVLAVALAVGAVGAGVTLRRRRRQQDQRRRQV
ncbi:MAG TPA: hypothetical protein VK204_17430 [Nocardioidaceae bacterium]|nr:hypothetical protein [Nocardioidaceae bacterium]